MSSSLILSISTRNHKSGIIAASLSRNRSTMHYPIERYSPLRTTACALRNRPAIVPIKRKHEIRRTALAHRSRNSSRRATGDLLMDDKAISDPNRFSAAQVQWAKKTVRTLEAEAIDRWTVLLTQCRDCFGYEYPEVVKRAESSQPRDLTDEPAIRQLALEATWRDAGQARCAVSASEAECAKLRENIESLRARLGWNHTLEELMKSRADVQECDMELY